MRNRNRIWKMFYPHVPRVNIVIAITTQRNYPPRASPSSTHVYSRKEYSPMDLRIGIINKSKEVKDEQVARHTPNLELQVREHFEPLWGIGSRVEFFEDGRVPRDYMRLVLLDTSDDAEYLGYHDLTAYGRAQSKVFCKGLGKKWTVTASHEILEMIADRYVNKVATLELPNGDMRLY